MATPANANTRGQQQAEATVLMMNTVDHENQLKTLQWQITSLQQTLQDTRAQMEEERVHTKCQIQMLWASLGRIHQSGTHQPNGFNNRQPMVLDPRQQQAVAAPSGPVGPRQKTGQLTGIGTTSGQPRMMAAPHPGHPPIAGRLITVHPGQQPPIGAQRLIVASGQQPQMAGQLMAAPPEQNAGYFYRGSGQPPPQIAVAAINTGNHQPPSIAGLPPMAAAQQPENHNPPEARPQAATASKRTPAITTTASPPAAAAATAFTVSAAASAAAAATLVKPSDLKKRPGKKGAPVAAYKKPAAARRARTTVSKRPIPTTTTLAKEDNLLFRGHLNIESLWNEYNTGIGKRKAAKNFTKKEISKVKVKYEERNVVWACISNLVDSGVAPSEAIDRIYKVHGKKLSVLQIIHRMGQAQNTNTVHKLLKPDTADKGSE